MNDAAFDEFGREYSEWSRQTQLLPVRRAGHVAASAFELGLDHLVDHFLVLGRRTLEEPTRFDYPNLARENLGDLEAVRRQCEQASLTEEERQAYSVYLDRFAALLDRFAGLPVAADGHLGFTRAALSAFRFLVDEFGFAVTERSPIAVAMAGDALMVELSYSPDSPMGTVWITNPREDEKDARALVLDDFAYVDTGEIVFDYDRFDLRQPSGVARLLETAAVLIRRHGQELLTGDPEAFRRFQREAEAREQAYVELMEREQSDRS